MKLAKSSAWSFDEISSFLDGQKIPIRIAVEDGDFPLVCSVWFQRDGQTLKCASHESSHLVKCLKKAGKCGFEIAPEQPPYKGVRGKASVRLLREGAKPTLNGLIQKYLGDESSSLGNWLLSRVEQEYVIELTPEWLTSWDYSERMSES